ncbi:DUF2795 domain-containing protein [Streptomyces sp. NPDC051183]|uniref:DUF2795 domain-containing protein n=1 Tax=Streptomyces sp. NPDC051183 TaxID=3155165 RepID=UPI003417EB70
MSDDHIESVVSIVRDYGAWPATKQQLVNHADRYVGTDKEYRNLDDLPEGQYNNAQEVRDALEKVKTDKLRAAGTLKE